MTTSDRARARLEQAIEARLRAHPQGLGEYALLQALRESDAGLVPERLDDELSLFQTHFLLFHCLYRIDQRLSRMGEGRLEIGALCIRLLPSTTGDASQALGSPDPLRDYYLDLANLDTGREEVNRLLDGFWRRYLRQDARAEALAVLGLEAGADEAAIRQRYRRLAMQHHPDRGGDAARLQEINAALATLLGRG
ncbi:DNA-J related domain-containing protein [Thiohalobacter sp. IOR34]|uniref:DNA-J related domain-containing protein n=1 Tax=Thiohalobacter sp. IOR34 TaxID=3057176 RepID=UPI0025AFBF86|nr:DNA-J related domain-containing protein [Thiohalobacter sp. IOR34]WJW76113.1 DNA-J related domain-containing protein [Thiohalobacter sp. IOR34]